MNLEHMKEIWLLMAAMESDTNQTRLEYIARELAQLRQELYPVCPVIIPRELVA